MYTTTRTTFHSNAVQYTTWLCSISDTCCKKLEADTYLKWCGLDKVLIEGRVEHCTLVDLQCSYLDTAHIGCREIYPGISAVYPNTMSCNECRTAVRETWMRHAKGNDVMVKFILTEEERTEATDAVRTNPRRSTLANYSKNLRGIESNPASVSLSQRKDIHGGISSACTFGYIYGTQKPSYYVSFTRSEAVLCVIFNLQCSYVSALHPGQLQWVKR